MLSTLLRPFNPSDRSRVAIEKADSRDIPAMLDLPDELFRLESDFEPDREKQLCALRLILAHPEKGRSF